ncbi:MAG: PPOX class F420-dependent oxidoreductase [Polyangiaceae bacterium]
MQPNETLRRERYINVETFKRDGNGVKTPVWFVNVGDKLGVFTNGKSYKVKRLRRNSKVRVAACDARGGVGKSATWYEGEGHIVSDPQRIDAGLQGAQGQIRCADVVRHGGRQAFRAP